MASYKIIFTLCSSCVEKMFAENPTMKLCWIRSYRMMEMMWCMEDSDQGQPLRDPINDAHRCFHSKVRSHPLDRGTSVPQHRCALLGRPSENLNLCMLIDTVLQQDTQTFYFETDGLVGFQCQLCYLLTEPRLRLIDAFLFLGTCVQHLVFHARLRVKIDSILEDGGQRLCV